MGVAGKLRETRWRLAGHYTRPLPEAFTAPLQGAEALEVGGPSAVFRQDGLLPAYPALARVDGLQWAAATAWHALDAAAPYAPDGVPTGSLQIVDDADLAAVGDARYDAVLSSHVVEHLANPLRTLAAWRRVTRPGGHLLLVAPHMAGTFDHRRAITTLEHLRADRDAGTGEEDLTHLEETLRLHDRTRDADDAPFERWAQERRQNPTTRLLHHHVFTTTSLAALLREAGVVLLAAEVRYPHDIYLLGRWGGPPAPDPLPAALRASPFALDRAAA